MVTLTDTPFEVAHLVTSLRPPTPALVVVVKATFTLGEGGAPCALADAQEPCAGDAHFDDDPEGGVRFESDLAPRKPRGECLVVGSCHPPGGRAGDGASAVAFRVGRVERQLAVFGDRHWVRKLFRWEPSAPEPFAAMPLRWERAYGGPTDPRNPLGRGDAEVETPDGPRRPLPNVERATARVASPDDAPEPEGCAPVPRTFPARAGRAGTYDEAWLRARWPWPPEDFDLAYYNAAPPTQQIDGYWRGDEEVVLRNLVPGRPLVETRLPGLRARAFLQRAGDEALAELPLELDTVTVDAERARVFCLFRAVVEVRSESLDDVATLFVLHDPLSARRPLDQCRAALDRRRAALAAEDAAFQPVPVPEDDEDDDPEGIAATTARRHDDDEGEGDDVTTRRRDDDEDDDGDESLAATTERRPEGAKPLPDSAEAEALDKLAAAFRAIGVDIHAPPPTPPPVPAMSPEEVRAALARFGIVDPPEAPPAAAPAAPVGSAREAVIARVGRGESLSGEDLTGADLHDLDLAGVDLRGAILQGANLRGASLDRARLDEAVLAGADLSGAKLREATLSRADLTGVTGPDADLARATLEGAVLSRAALPRAVLRRVAARSAELVDADLSGADLEDAALDLADLAGATLAACRLAGATLVEASLERVEGEGAVLDRCDLTRLRATGARLGGASLRDVRGEDATWVGAVLTRADFAGAEVSRADFTGAALEGARFDGGDLRGCVFRGARLARASAVAADALGAVFEAADLAHADLRGANLHGAEFWRARTDGARLDAANVARTLLAARRP